MRWFWLFVYSLTRLVVRVLFGIGHKVQWLGWKAMDKASVSGGVVRYRSKKPLTTIWRLWNKLVGRNV